MQQNSQTQPKGKKTINKLLSLTLILSIYLLSFGVGYIAHYLMKQYTHVNPIINLLISTVVATIIIFIFNLILKNASIYDPYWSIQPIFIIIVYYLNYSDFYPFFYFALTPLLFWALRLTINWIIGFEGLSWEDWRYAKIKKEHPKLKHLIVFVGIMLMPTLVVFSGLMPIFTTIWTVSRDWFPSLISLEAIPAYFGGSIILFGTIIELISDEQMRKHRKLKTNTNIDSGLWRYSRHPNYLGEITVWFGVFISFSMYAWCVWYAYIGICLMVALFLFVSIPMAEKRYLEKYPQYELYKKSVSMLLILPRKKPKAPHKDD